MIIHFDAPRDRLKESVIHAFIILNESITKLGLSEAWEIGFHVTWVGSPPKAGRSGSSQDSNLCSPQREARAQQAGVGRSTRAGGLS